MKVVELSQTKILEPLGLTPQTQKQSRTENARLSGVTFTATF